mmetsp:Transcript_20711/g.71581  ORF Transcript_20711/g.71581 Transcript_20711/m.71581 type:complete len:86 (+) Transcript_20711:499-756(+)
MRTAIEGLVLTSFIVKLGARVQALPHRLRRLLHGDFRCVLRSYLDVQSIPLTLYEVAPETSLRISESWVGAWRTSASCTRRVGSA